MATETPGEQLSVALEREHKEIDAGIEAFLAELDRGGVDAAGLATTLDFLRRHIYLEERILFPPIRHGNLVMALSVMMIEHGEIWDTMDALEALAAKASDGAGHDRLRETCRHLLRQLETHNLKEEPVIYPAADTGLTVDQAAELAGFIETGVTPAGWVCQEAG